MSVVHSWLPVPSSLPGPHLCWDLGWGQWVAGPGVPCQQHQRSTESTAPSQPIQDTPKFHPPTSGGPAHIHGRLGRWRACALTFGVLVTQGGRTHVTEAQGALAAAVDEEVAVMRVELGRSDHLREVLHVSWFDVHDVWAAGSRKARQWEGVLAALPSPARRPWGNPDTSPGHIRLPRV